jgi:type II secretory pathway pseudopilin PulG
MIRRLNSRGDTIVEVLIAILVVSTVLSGAFVSARRSQNTVRSSQERVEALRVAEAQIERIKLIAKTDQAQAVLYSGGDQRFCVNNSNAKVAVSGSLPDLTSDSFTNPARCETTPSGVPFYSMVQRTAATNTFTVYTRWNGIGGSGKQEVQLAVRIDP